MKNVLNYYYNLNIENIHQKNKNYYFKVNNISLKSDFLEQGEILQNRTKK